MMRIKLNIYVKHELYVNLSQCNVRSMGGTIGSIGTIGSVGTISSRDTTALGPRALVVV